MWGEVGKRLVSRVDVIRFRSVCKKWRSSLPSPNRFPLQVPLPPDHSDLPVNNVPYFITQVNIYSVDVGSETKPQKVLMEFEEFDDLSNFSVKAFIPNGAKVDLEGNTRDFHRGSRLSFVAKAYRLHMAVPYFSSFGKSAGKRVEGRWQFILTYLRVSKIVLISSNGADGIDHASHAPLSDLSVVALLGRVGKLALLRLGGFRDRPNWDWNSGFCSHVIREIASYKGQLCAIDYTGRAFLMDYNSLDMTQIAAAPPGINQSQVFSMQLFDAHGGLYLVTRLKTAVDVKVYKMGVQPGKWLEVGDTGNQILFRGLMYNVCIPRDVLTSNYGSWMMKYKESTDLNFFSSMLLLVQHHMDDDDQSGGRASFICFEMRRILRFVMLQDSTTSLTSSILCQYESSIVCRTNYVRLLNSIPGFR